MKRPMRTLAVLVTSTVFVTLGGQAALADDISNRLDATIDATAEVMSLNVGGSSGTTQLYVAPTNGDGKNGCNLTGSTTLVVAVSPSNTSVATVSPSSVTFTSCGDTPTLTVTPVAQGSASITVSQTSNNTGGTFTFTTATFTVNVAPPANTAPSVIVDGVSAGASYEIGSVPAATCKVTDTEDGSSSFPATLSAISGPLAAYGIGSETASCSYTDGGGLTASASKTYSIVDTGNPVITFVRRTAANGNGWNNGDVTVEWSCSDAGSGVVGTTVTKTISSEGADRSATGTCMDNAGNTASDTQSGINIDKTAPVITYNNRTAANINGWNNDDVAVNWACSDALSGVVSATESQSVSTEGLNQSATGTCTDLADNTASDTQSGINIDKTAPSVSLVGGPTHGGSYYFDSVPAAPTCSASDALSGVDGACLVSSYGATVGSHTVAASASDKAENSASASATYEVLAWTLKGFYQPVDMNGVYNTVKGGSTVPLKFEVFSGGNELTNVSAVKSFTQTKINCDGTAPVDDLEFVTTGQTALRYDSTGGHYVQNWQTPRLPGACYRVTMTTQDESSLVAYFKLK